MSKEALNLIKKNLGYTEEEMKIFMENKKNIEILKKTPNLLNKTIVIEVIESHGCNSQHLVGEFFFLIVLGIYLLNSVLKEFASLL